MSARELVALGTASQVPTRYRNHNGYLLRWDGVGLLFDPGEGTQRQMVIHGVAAHDLHHVLVTHFHGDHCLGLAGLIQRISLDRVPHPVRIHYPASGQVFFDRLRHASIFRDHSILEPRPVQEPGEIAREEDFSLHTLPLDHGVPSWGYRLQEKDGRRMLPERLRALGLRGRAIGELVAQGEVEHEGARIRVEDVSVPRPGQSVAFVMDTRLCDNAFRLASGVDLLICESTFLTSEAREARQHGHMTAAQAGRVAREAGARRLVLTHFSQRYPDIRRFLEEALVEHDDVVAVCDGDVVEVPKRAKD
ncbi:MAG: ribonuclease Z [Alphaproteobacteria bacterium]|nr:ribonuclease Z [Alphaproteobacteria bacterium]